MIGLENPIGIMQGRLSEPVEFRLQAFPTDSWQQEFANAKEYGFDTIEWLFEADDGRGHGFQENPLWSEAGRDLIRQQIIDTGVRVKTCCADFFMPHPFFRVTEAERLENIAILNRLILNASLVGIQSILIPVLEISEIRSGDEKDLLLKSLKGPLELAAEKGILLGLETELPAEEYLAVIIEANHPNLGVYYDTGNNAAQGHDITAAAHILGPYLVGVHVKDRKKGGPSVLLGDGDCDFDGFFKEIKQSGYSGPIILQTAFGSDYLEIAVRHLQFIKEKLR